MTIPDEKMGRPAAVVEVVGLLLVLLLFTRLHAVLGEDVAAATANARALQSVEHDLQLDVERATNQWLVDRPALIGPAVYFYRSYYVVVVGVLVWVFVRRRAVYRPVRRVLLAMTVLVLPVYWALPMSPPRFASPGVVDIVAEHDVWGHEGSRDVANYTAMPSMHVGFAAWCGYAVWSALRVSHPRTALLAWTFPALMVVDVLTTGNHYVLDVVGSAVLLGTAVAVASVWGRMIDRRASPA